MIKGIRIKDLCVGDIFMFAGLKAHWLVLGRNENDLIIGAVHVDTNIRYCKTTTTGTKSMAWCYLQEKTNEIKKPTLQSRRNKKPFCDHFAFTGFKGY